MAVLAMQKIGILTFKKDADVVLEVLQESGDFQPVRQGEGSEDMIHAVETKLANLKFVIDFLSSYSEAPKNFREKMLGERVEAHESKALALAEEDFSDLISETEQCEAERNRIATARIKNREMRTTLENWKELHFSLSDAERSKSTRVFVGSLEEKDFLDFEAEISQNDLLEVRKISTTEKHLYFVLIAHISVSDFAEEILKRFHFSSANLEIFQKNVAEQLDALGSDLQKLDVDEDHLSKKAQKLSAQLPSAKLAYDGLLWKRDRRVAESGAETTKETIVFFGFAPKNKLRSLRRRLSAKSKTVEVFLEETEDVHPVALENSKITRPFEIITNFFGTPRTDEIDPTPFLAPFYFLFFGFCLTDAGYGLLLVLATLFALRVLPLGRDARQMTLLLLGGGISTTIMGVLFGGYLGLTTEQIPFLVNPETGKFYGQMFDAINELVPRVMIFAYGLGVAHLLLGVILGGVSHFRRGQKSTAILGNGAVFVTVLLGIFVALSPQSLSFALPIFGILAVLMLWGFGPSDSSFFVRPLLGIFGLLNEAISWLSNVLSYSRLFSLGLATGIIALAFNSIAVTLGGMLPLVIGIPVAILIILFGHTLNIGLNLLGAFVHSARLQFVEFFGKFLEGGGTAFSPLSRKSKYVFDPLRS